MIDLIADRSGQERPRRAVADADDLLEAVRDAVYETGALAEDAPWLPDAAWALLAFAGDSDAVLDVFRTYDEAERAADACAALRIVGVTYAPVLRGSL